ARVLIHEERLLPSLPAIGRAKDAAFRLRPVRVPERGGENDVRVARINDDAADSTRLLQTHQSPRLSRVSGFVDAGPDRNVATDPRFAGACPNDIRIRRGNGERADRGDGLIVEDRAPMRPAVSCLEYPARGRAGVINVGLPRHASDGADPVAHRADVTIPKLVKD